MTTITVKVKDRITIKICGVLVASGEVTGFGEHKGREVIDFKDTDGHNRFAYPSQIQFINGQNVDKL